MPDELVEIPLEYFQTAIEWLQAQEQVDPGRLAVIGNFRGGELALLFGSRVPVIKAVVSYAGSGVLHSGYGSSSATLRTSAWSWQGEPLPFYDDHGSLTDYLIPVAEINGPVLLISGNDQMWPSGLYTALAYKRLKDHEHPCFYKHLRYSGAGHRFRFPYRPTTEIDIQDPVSGETFSIGGTPEVNAAAAADAWWWVLHFLGFWKN